MLAIGLMSGTSLDGIDAVIIEWPQSAKPRLLTHYHQPYGQTLASRLRAVGAETSLASVLALDAELAGVYASAVEALLTQSAISRDQIAGIGLHGQTVWHAPTATPPVTCQIGDPSRLAEATGMTVVADFRQRDLAAGGEGAPLAPYFHGLLFGSDSPRVIVNLGGIANISLLDAGGAVRGGFDCGPANTLLDAWMRKTQGHAFDADGRFAASGQVDAALLARLKADPYFHRPPPKSTGPETFNLAWLDAQLKGNEAAADVQATLSALTAESLAEAIEAWGNTAEEVVICGGGVGNQDLLERLKAALSNRKVITAEALGWPAESIEAVGFACLACLTLQGKPIDLTAVTGANHPVVAGGVYPG